jgi:hypothetical protein
MGKGTGDDENPTSEDYYKWVAVSHHAVQLLASTVRRRNVHVLSVL